MGAGKSLAARTAGAALNVEAVDSDQLLERRLGSSIEAYFSSHGERAFREQEEEAVTELLDAPPSPVLSLGGGSITSERVRSALERHTVVLLDVDAETAWQRCRSGRPLARDRDRFEALHAERAPLYTGLADAILPADRRDEVRRALPAIRALGAAPPGTKLLWAGEYPVFVGDGLLGAGDWPLEGNRYLVTDEAVGPLYAERLGDVARDIRIPPGERHKTRRDRQHRAARAGLGRAWATTTTWSRSAAVWWGTWRASAPPSTSAGCRSCRCRPRWSPRSTPPTAARPASTSPRARTTSAPTTSPRPCSRTRRRSPRCRRRKLAAGWAEVVKTGLIAGGDLWRRVRSRDAAKPDRDLVLACARVKLRIVAQDERDAGLRQTLNLGHTVGHAIETVTDYERYRHGEAVGLGLLAALTLSQQPELRDEVEDLLAARGLPTTLDPAIDRAAVAAAVQRDKKRRGGRVGFVLVEEPGRTRTGCLVNEGDLRAAIEELAR